MTELGNSKIFLLIGAGIVGFLGLKYILNPAVVSEIIPTSTDSPAFQTQNEKENIGLKNTSSDGIVPPKQNLEKPTKEETFNENSTAPIPENKDSEVLNTGKVGTM